MKQENEILDSLQSEEQTEAEQLSAESTAVDGKDAGVVNSNDVDNSKSNGNNSANNNEVANDNNLANDNGTANDNGFELLRENFSRYKTVEELPQEVRDIAAENSIGLFDAMLRYEFAQRKNAEAALAMQAANAQRSTGSQRSERDDVSADISALMRGIRGI